MLFPSGTTLLPNTEASGQDLLFSFGTMLCGALAVGCIFYLTGSTVFNSFLGGIFAVAVVVMGGSAELLMSLFLVIMLKLGGPTVVALLKPWGFGSGPDETLRVVMETGFPQLTVGIFVLLFLFITIPQLALSRWRSE